MDKTNIKLEFLYGKSKKTAFFGYFAGSQKTKQLQSIVNIFGYITLCLHLPTSTFLFWGELSWLLTGKDLEVSLKRSKKARELRFLNQ